MLVYRGTMLCWCGEGRCYVGVGRVDVMLV